MIDYTNRTTNDRDECQITVDIRGKNAGEFANIWLRNHPYGNIILTGWSSYSLPKAVTLLNNLANKANAKLQHYCNSFILENKQ